jgi:hypothetical protein
MRRAENVVVGTPPEQGRTKEGGRRILLVCTGSGIKTTYEDGVDYQRFAGDGEVRVTRNSHVDPMPGAGVAWGIFWLGEFQKRFGECTAFDDDGKPFTTKQAAVDHELKMIDRDYYRLSD